VSVEQSGWPLTVSSRRQRRDRPFLVAESSPSG
jgi:hypothetical protein